MFIKWKIEEVKDLINLRLKKKIVQIRLLELKKLQIF